VDPSSGTELLALSPFALETLDAFAHARGRPHIGFTAHAARGVAGCGRGSALTVTF
jgi:hypothetical protein